MKKNINLNILIIIIALFQNCQKDEDVISDSLSEEKEYLLDVAIDKEFGSNVSQIKKWNTNIKIYLKNTSYSELVNEFEKVKDEINQLSSSIMLERVYDETDANFIIFFTDKDTYTNYEPNAIDYVENNWGFVWLYWNSECEVYRGSMYVDIVRTNDINCQKHLLREDLTQGIGLLNDSYKYSESIFYENWTCTNSYAEIDKKVIAYFLNPQMKAGMVRDQVIDILKKL